MSRPSAGLRRQSREDGFTLVEMSIATLILAIAMVMSFGIVTTVVKSAVNGTDKGASSSAASLGVQALDPYLRDAITGTAARSAYPAANITCPNSGQAWQTTDDFQVELCTTRSSQVPCTSANAASLSTSCPELFKLWIDPTTCSASTCTLQISDLSASGSPVVYSLSDVHCDASCVADRNLDMPALFTYLDSAGHALTSPPSPSSDIASVLLDLSVAAPGSKGKHFSEVQDLIWPTASQVARQVYP